MSKKKQVQFMIALTILAWATETLRHQWAFGSEANEVDAVVDVQPIILHPSIPAAPAFSGDADDAVATPTEHFAARPTGTGRSVGGTLELRSDATIVGAELKLKQICRWTENDAAAFAPLADFVIDRIKPGTRQRRITLEQVRSTLRDAGVNLAAIDFAGSAACTVVRSDAGDDRAGVNDWLASQTAALAVATPAAATPASATQPPGVWRGEGGIVVTFPTTRPNAESSTSRSLRERLIADLAVRLKIPADTLQMEFRPQDERLLSLSEPAFQFDVQPVRVRDLGDVSWQVTILASGSSQKVRIDAVARAWQNQLIITRAVANRQVIRDEDCVERRTMADKIPIDPLLTRAQLVGQQSSQALSSGDVMTARLVEAVPMVRAGEFVTITLTQGAVQITSVARAMEAGAYGQNIRVKNETTRDIYNVTMTGPQAATLVNK